MADNAYAVVAVGPDRPGLLADIEGAVRSVVGELHGDPHLTFLPGGNIGIMLAIHTAASHAEVERAVQPMSGEGLSIDVHQLEDRTEAAEPAEKDAKYVLRVRSMGRPGVVGALERIVARHGGMIIDFGTRIGGGRIAVLRVDLPEHSEEQVAALTQDLYSAAEQMGIGVKFYDTVRGEHSY